MGALMSPFHSVDQIRVYFRRHPRWLIVIMCVGVGFAVVQSYLAADGQSQRATAAAQKASARAVRVEAENRQASVHAIAVVGHRSLLRACLRGRGLRAAVRANAIAGRTRDRAFDRFLKVAIRRAEVVAASPSSAPSIRTSARDAIPIYADLRSNLDINPVIPPKPQNCSSPKVVPTVQSFEDTARAAINDGS